MKLIFMFVGAALLIPTPFLAAQTDNTYPTQNTPTYSHRDNDAHHAEIELFGDYLRYTPVSPSVNFAGLGARVGFYMNPFTSLEAGMSYDFERNYTSTTNTGSATGINTTLVRSRLRPITGLFGPRFQIGTGGFDAFVTGKVGFVNFSSTNTNAVNGSTFTNAVNGLTGSGTHLAAYPGVGIEGFWGWFGLRLDAGDEIIVNNGTSNNVKVDFGPAFRF